MRKFALSAALLVTVAMLGGCGESDAAKVTSKEAGAFEKQVKEQVPYMKQFGNADDFKTVAEAVCDGFDDGQNYGRVSKTVGAYIDKPASDGVVDDVIRVAVATACPGLEQKVKDSQG